MSPQQYLDECDRLRAEMASAEFELSIDPSDENLRRIAALEGEYGYVRRLCVQTKQQRLLEVSP